MRQGGEQELRQIVKEREARSLARSQVGGGGSVSSRRRHPVVSRQVFDIRLAPRARVNEAKGGIQKGWRAREGSSNLRGG
jgi:hypothetical protein